MEMDEDIVVVGAGIAGLAVAVALHRVGLSCRVLEEAAELRTTGAALTLFPNAWRALGALGVAHKLTPFYPPLQSVSFTNVSAGRTQKVPLLGVTASDRLGVRSVHRKKLLEALVEDLPAPTIRFGSKLTSIQKTPGSSSVTLSLEDDTKMKTKVLIGCDGVRSLVAQWLGLAEPVDAGRSGVRGLAVFPEGHGLPNQITQILDDGVRAGYLPLNENHVYWCLIRRAHPHDNEIWKNPELIKRDVTQRVAKNYPSNYLKVVEHSELDSLTQATLFYRRPWSLLFGRLSKGNVTVAGDALHPMTSDIAQGGCSALEDAVVLARKLSQEVCKNGRIELTEGAIEEGLRNYGNERRRRCARLIAFAIVAGWFQSKPWWWVTMIRDRFCYGLMFNRIVDLLDYDCGQLPVFKLD